MEKEKNSNYPPKPDSYLLSEVQKLCWKMSAHFHSGLPYDQISITYRILGMLDFDQLQETFLNLLKRHDILRIRVSGTPDNPQAELREIPVRFPIAFIDLEGCQPDFIANALSDYAERESTRLINLARDWPLRCYLLRISGEEHVLLLTIHHLISDGWSMGVVVRDLFTLYHAYEPERLPRPKQFSDYITLDNRQYVNGTRNRTLRGGRIIQKRQTGS